MQFHNSAIGLADKLAQFSEHWAPRVVAEVNDYQIKLAKLQGDFVWHSHDDTDEVFLVLKGHLRIDFRDQEGRELAPAELDEGELCVVKKGDQHKPFAEKECHVMLIEPRGVVNTGEAGGELTAENDQWI